MRVKRCARCITTGRARSIGSALPPAMIASVPFSAPATPPDTGASTRPMPFSSNLEAKARADAGAMLEKSTTTRPGRAPETTPSAPNSTCSTAC
jgi:hypothetical protein